MSSSTASSHARLALVACVVLCACSSGNGKPPATGAAGASGSSAGSSGAGSGGSGGSVGGGGAANTAGNGGAAGTAVAGTGGDGQSLAGSSGADAGGGAAGANADGAAGAAGRSAADAGGADAAVVDLTKAAPTAGCGADPGQMAGVTVRYTIQTAGVKPMGCADSKCGPWSYAREYFVTLPVGYDQTKAYPLVLQGPGCGGDGTQVYPLTFKGSPNVDNTVIRVGLTPPPNDIGHVTNPNQGCFDDKEGDDSVDFVFYEDLYDHLAGTLCFDANRVFASGNSSGAWLANELGCKYAGAPHHAVRGIMTNEGGLPSQAMYEPTCTNAPMAGMFVFASGDVTNAIPTYKFGLDRAISVNGCAPGTTFATAQFQDFPIGAPNADSTCKKIVGCSALTPLVVCPLATTANGGHDDVVNPGFSAFVTLFETAPLFEP